MPHLDAPTVIRTKRDGAVLSDAAIDWVIDGYTHGRVADEQMSALLMAIFLKGMGPGEITRWTAAMVDSGERFDFTDLRRDGKPLALVDKHSTGGVGDKITIPLLPVVMACGASVPQAPGVGSDIPAARWTSLRLLLDSPPSCRKIRSGNNFPTSVRRSSPQASWRRPTARSTHCATSPRRSTRCR
ncbi:pyrimidine-nucleoside phosphorylase [Mycolicibacterium conceptionense]|uniref:Pyrimidine-nucleoside phosphorylase n=1 Tax=Mycolicibacterium conceptionense TaxID=451644 RepID=A0A0U1D246_9MYCO|nr:pyrimidine-nucleoside phosphorylase [Mycolicibacterium conceptionense]